MPKKTLQKKIAAASDFHAVMTSVTHLPARLIVYENTTLAPCATITIIQPDIRKSHSFHYETTIEFLHPDLDRRVIISVSTRRDKAIERAIELAKNNLTGQAIYTMTEQPDPSP